jgi:hypothetical protein
LTEPGGDFHPVTKEAYGHIAEVMNLNGKWMMKFGAYGPEYFILHQEGGKVSGRPPIRKPIQINEHWQQQMAAAFTRAITPWVVQQLKLKMATARTFGG